MSWQRQDHPDLLQISADSTAVSEHPRLLTGQQQMQLHMHLSLLDLLILQLLVGLLYCSQLGTFVSQGGSSLPGMMRGCIERLGGFTLLTRKLFELVLHGCGCAR